MADDSQNSSPAAGAPQGQSGNYFLDTYGPAAQPAPPPAAGAAPADPYQKARTAAHNAIVQSVTGEGPNTGNYFRDKYGEAVPPPQEAAPAAPEKDNKAMTFLKGMGGSFNSLATTLARVANASGAGMAAAEDPEHADAALAGQKEFHDRFVEPLAARQADFDLGPGATWGDKLSHGLGYTAALLAQVFLTGGGVGAATEEALGGGLLARTAGRAAAATLPATSAAVETGNKVLEATGDRRAAAVAAAAAYTTNVAMASVGGMPGNIFARVGAGAATGAAVGEAARQVQNVAMPEGMKQPFDLGDVAINAIMFGAGALPGHPGAEQVSRPVQEAHTTVMEKAQQAAFEREKAEGGDNLDATKAAIATNAEVGAHHDAAAVQGARDIEEHSQAAALQAHRIQQLMEEEEAQAPVAAQAQKDREVEAAYGQREREQAAQQPQIEAQKDQDFTAAKNQVGDQTVANAEGAEKGGGAEPAPTIADALPPEQLEALQRLKAQRAGQPPAEPTPQETAKAIAPDVRPLPPLKAAKERAAQAPTEAPTPKGEEPLPEGGPPPVTASSLAQRRQQALDAAMAEKVRAGAQEKALTTVPETVPQAEQQASPATALNRLQMIRQAAQKRQAAEAAIAAAAPPQAEEAEAAPKAAKQYQAVNRESGAKTADLKDFEAAKAYRDEHPDEDILPAASAKVSAEDLEQRPIGAPADSEEKAQRAMMGDMIRADAEARGKPTKESATRLLQPKLDRLGDTAADIHIHDSMYDDDPNVQKELHTLEQLGHDPAGVRGYYSPTEDAIHLFANAHESHADLETTLMHELAHLGVTRATGGRTGEYVKTMDQIYDTNEDARKYADFYASQFPDFMKPFTEKGSLPHRRYAMDEYAAHLAERPWEQPTTWGKIVQAVRNSMRRIGLVHEWTDNDIRDLILRGNKAQAAIRSDWGGRAETLPTSYSLKDDDHFRELSNAYPDDHPVGQAARLAMTKEEQAKYAPSFVNRVKDAMENLGYKTVKPMLSTIDMRHLPDFVDPREMPSVQKFLEANDRRRGAAGRMQKDSTARLKSWSRDARDDPDANAMLGTLMHASTIGGVDPSKPYEARFSPEEVAADPAKAQAEQTRQSLHQSLQTMFNQLGAREKGGDWQQRYSDVRNDYQANRDATWKALEARINETAASEDTKKNLLGSLRRQFEASTVKGPYFPLFRTGDYWARAKDDDGNHVSFSRFETTAERKAWVKEMGDAGFSVDQGKKDTDKSLMERIDPEFMRQVMDVVGEHNASLQDEIWQTYLRAMPEMSMRKSFIHRQGRLGFSADAMRAYAYNMFHGSQQIARLQYGNRMDSILDQIKQEADAVQSANPGTMKAEMASGVASEMAKRNQWIKNPQNSAWTNAVNQLGFGWYLGFAPATAFRIHTQNSMLASPILAAKFGQKGATTELVRAVAQWAKAKGSLGDTLRGEERQAFDEASDQGMFTNTWAATLGQGANDKPVTGWRSDLMNAAQWMFNAIEHKNRMTTFLAAYRLGKQQGMEHDEAFRTANQMTWDAHLDYGNDNRARFLQNDFMKVAGQFKQYPLGMAYRLARDFRDSLPGILKNDNITDAQRGQAQKQFAGLLLRSFMYAGAVGLPAAWLAEAGVNAAFGTKDKPFDAREALHSYLQKEMGRSVADAITYGPASALTGASLSAGASYSDLLYKTPQNWHEMDTGEKVMDAVEQALGPAFGALINAAHGFDIGMKGNPERGLEHVLPPAVTGPVKAARLGTQGALNLRGQKVMSPDELGDGWSKSLGVSPDAIRYKNLFLQAAGFTPQVLSDRYAQNSVMAAMQKQILKRKADLEQDFSDAALSGDQDKEQQVEKEVSAFRQAHPGVPINLSKSVISRARANAKARNGVSLNKGLKGEITSQYGGGEE